MGRSGILWVTNEVPDHDGGGGNQRQAFLLEAVAARMPVDLLVAGRVVDDAVRAAVRSLTEVEAVPFVPPSRVGRRAQAVQSAWLAHRPLDVVAQDPVRRALAPRIWERTGSGDVGAVVLHHQSLAPLATGPRRGRARWALHLFHAGGDRAEQLAAVEPNPLRRALLHRDAANARRVERHAVERVDVLFVTTDEDGARLAVPGTPVVVVPQGIDAARYVPSAVPDDPVVLFTGSLDYEPNVDGVQWFTTEVWPAVRAAFPAARLQVVGRRPAPEVRALDGREGVAVHADVPSMAPWLASARVAVIPLRAGTGVRVKALEAMAAGRPVVATTVAMEGLAAGPDAVTLADDPATFARAVIDRLRDRDGSSAMGAAGRRWVEQRASWSSSADRLVEALT